ncbi:hypothetical protein JSE7799_00686 [Jannaschia seosinensis]|uniref:Excalibur calcium-binding domain-containing protein n=1 Tax=Jannaschia seosinensis TaxID=313367 RepID=A0A0M7B7N0_9RHOB|nr:hypothetical protein [Jannaschia seosinensis]CUH25207.1 hypothetical protein JSE7799_00686 [Jannaschia seosinensis]
MRILLVLPFLAACAGGGVETGSTSPERRAAARLSALDTNRLWALQARPSDPLELARAEAELGSRGQFVARGAYLGRRTLAIAGRARYRRGNTDPETDVLNCGDFLTEAAAQAEFLGSGGPQVDRHNLDPDGDGLACNWAETLRQATALATR